MTSSPAGATVSIDGRVQGVTPLEISLARRSKGPVIRIEAAGYDPVEIRPKRVLSAGSLLGNLLLGLAPAMVPAFIWSLAHDDTSSGAAGTFLIWGLGTVAIGGLLESIDIGGNLKKGYEWKPGELTVTLRKADGPPRVETVLVDADELRNIVWIRVRRD